MVAAVVVLAVVALAIGFRGGDDPPPVAQPVASPAPSSSAPTTPTTTPTPTPQPREGIRLEVPSVDLDVEVLPIETPANGVLDPPTLDEAYWIDDLGALTPEADNTAYIAAHSWDDGDAAFNPLFDRGDQVAEVNPGDEITVTGEDGVPVTWRVERTERYPKGELAETDEVWRKVPGRLILITCFQRNDGGASRDNLVVYASLA